VDKVTSSREISITIVLTICVSGESTIKLPSTVRYVIKVKNMSCDSVDNV